jgi:hypothetical protein
MDLSFFDDLIPSNNAPADAGALGFDDLIPQESKQAIPVPPRRPESLGGTPESVPAGTITTTQPAWAKPGYYAEPAPALAPLKAEPKPNVATNLTNPNQDQDIQAQLAAAGIDTSQYETNTNQPAWAKPGFVPTAPKPGILEVAGRAARQGLYDALTDVGQSAAVATTGKADEKAEKNKQTDPLIANILNQTLGESWDDPNYWTALIVHGATASSPFLGGAAAGAALTAESGPGAFVGGALGGGAGLALQTLGPAYISAIKDGLSPDKAFDRAWEETGIGFVSGVIQGALPEFKLFGTTSKKLVTDGVEKVVNVAKAPIKEALFQILGAQPAAGVAQHEVTNVFEGKGNLTPEQIFQEYITNAASGAALVAAHSAVKSTVGALSERGPAADENSALSDTAINDGNPPSGGAAVAADESAALGATPLADPRAEMLEKVRAAIAANGAKPGEPNFVGPTEPVGPSKIAQPGEPDFVGPTEPIGPNPVQGPEKPVTEQGNLNADTVPEAPATIEEQRKALAAGTKKVVLYPEGTGETPPQVEGKNIQRYKVPGVGVFDYIAGKDGTTAAKIRDAVKNGTLSDLLELGGVDKAEVAESVAKGNPEVAVTETTPEGVPVKEAAGTTETAPDQVAALEATKTAPENKIETKDSRRVLTDRITANSKAAGQVLADSTNTNSKAADALADLDKTLQEKTAPAPEVVQDRVQVAPKAAAAKKVSAARAEPVAETKDGFTLFPGTDNEITFRTDEYPTKDHNSIAMYGNKIVPNAEGELNRPSKFTSEKDFDRRSGIILPDQFENTLKSKALADIFKKYVDRKITKDELVQQLKDTITSEANAKLETVKNTPEVAPKAAEVLETAAKRSPEKPVTPEVTTSPTDQIVSNYNTVGPVRYKTGVPTTADVLHGTVHQFERMSRDKLGSNTGAPSAKEAFFFTDSPSMSNVFSGNPEQLAPISHSEILERAKNGPSKKTEALNNRYDDMRPEEKVRYNALEKLVDKVKNPTSILTKIEGLLDNADKLATQRFLAKSRAEAGEPAVGRTVLAQVKMDNPFVYDFSGERARPESYAALIAKAKEAGHDGVIFTNTYDGGVKGNVFAVFNEEQIRDRFGNTGSQKTAEVTPKVTTSPTARTSRILESQTPESRAAGEAMLKQQLANEKNLNADNDKLLLTDGEGNPIKGGSNWTEEERAQRTANNDKASKVTSKFLPNEETEGGYSGRTSEATEARQAILKRAQAMVDEADKQGIEIPDRPGRQAVDESMHHNADAVLLNEARSLINKKKPERANFQRFVNNEKLLRAGKLEDVIAGRKIEGDEAKKIQQTEASETAGAAEANDLGESAEDIAIRREEGGEEESNFKTPEEAYKAGQNRQSIFDINKIALSNKEEELIAKLEARRDDPASSKSEKETAQKNIDRLNSGEAVDEALVAKYVTKGEDKAGTFKVETSGRRKMKELYGSLRDSPRRAREGIEEAEGEPKPPKLRLHPDEILHHTTLSDAMDQMTIGDLRNANDLNKRIVGTVLRRLREKVGGTDVLVVSQEALDRMNPDTRPGSVDGYYDPRFDHIVISDRMMGKGKFDASLLAHEGMHALVQMGIHTDPALKADIQALLDHVKSQMPNSKYYGFKDVHEFVSEAMSNPRFQEMLMSIEVPKDMAASFGLDKRHNSVWHAMLSSVNDAFLKIRNLFGNDAKAYDALSAIIHLTERAETSADEIREPLRQMREFDVLLSQGRGEIEALENEFIKRGVPISDARNLAEMVHEHLGDNLDMQKAEPIITQLAAQYSKPTPNAGVTPQGNAPTPNAGVTPRGNAPTGPQGNIGPKGQAAIAKANKVRNSKTSDMLDTFREHAVDLNRPVEKLQEQIGGEFYEDKRLMESRISERERQMAIREAEEVKRLARDAEKAGMTMDDVSKALIARHAKERNADIEAKDPKVKDGSGISNYDAQAILDGISKDPAKQAVFDRAVKLNDQLREIELNKLVEDGLLSKKQAQKLRNQYKEYTSLRGFADEDIAEAMGQRMGGLIGRDGVSVIGNEYRTAGGRKTESDNALHNMFLQARRAIIRGERNRVLKSLADAVRKAHNVMGNDSPVRVANSVNDRAIRSFDRATADPHILGFKEDGVQKFLVFKDPALAEAVQRIRPDELPAFFKQVNSLTNGIKSIWTHYSPTFIVRHFLFRYPIEAITNIRALREQGVNANPMGYLKDAFGNIADVYRYLDGNETAIKDPGVMAYIKEMAETGGIVNFKNIAGELNVKKQIEQLAAQKPNNPIAAAKQFFGAWEQMLNSADAAQRLAAYIRARKAGIDPKPAAIIARDITVDFGRKGRSAGWINIWVPFGNVAMQTTGRMAANFKTSPSYRRTVFGIMAGITGIGMMNYMYGGKDKNGKSALENIPEYERTQNLILMTPFHNKNGERIYFKMPLPYPLFAVNATATAASKLVASKMGLTKSTPGEITSMVLHGAAETFTPLGHQIGNLSTLATPELARFITDISANKGWNGNVIHTNFNKKDVPHSQQGFKTTDQSWKTIAGVLAKMGLDMYPEDIKYTVDHFVGTERRFFRDLPENIKNPSAGSVTGIVEGSIKPPKDK